MFKVQMISSIGAVALAMSAGFAHAQSYGANISVEAAKKVSAGTVAECAKNN